MNKYLMSGIAALTLCAGFTSCSHDDFEPMTQAEIDKAKYDMAFLNYVGGKIDKNQDWGFGSTTRGLTRAAGTWSENHTDAWKDYLKFEVPAGAVKVTKGGEKLANGTYHITKDFTGTLTFADNFVGDIYVETEITQFSGNLTTLNLYILEDGAWKCGSTTGTITVYNNGILSLGPWDLQNQNIKTIYNGGALKIGDGKNNPNFADGVTLYSDSESTIEILGGAGQWDEVDLKFACDVHGTMKVTGNLKIQNSKEQHICGLEVSGTLNMTQGNLRASHVKANEIKFDGASISLLKEGYIEAKTVRMPNSASHIKGYEGSHGLVIMGDFYLQNKNFFLSDAFSENIYFNVSGCVDATNCSVEDGHWNTVEDYLNAGREPGVKNRINNAEISGTPECGAPYGNPTTTPEPETPTTPTPEPTEEYDLRIIAEDLTADAADDFDFNDVVIDVKYGDPAVIEVKAAGGTLPLRICGKWEVHELFGVGTDCMVNTGASAKGLKGKDGLTAAQLQLDFAVTSPEEAKAIKIEVEKKSGWQELTAEKGEPAAKIAVGTDFNWLDERTSIKETYENFTEWVSGKLQSAKWWK